MTAQRWNFDKAHSSIQFTARHMVVTKVRGVFTSWDGDLEFDPENPSASSVNVTIDTASVDTREPKRDAHLRSADFFDVEKYPQLTFKSRKVQLSGNDLTVVGDLTIHGVTREVVLEGEYLGGGKTPNGTQIVGFSVKTHVNRKDYGLHWNVALETGGFLVGEKIEIAVEVEAVAAQQAERKAG
jgi:polyisoprenoid-binding protein YceI